MSLYDKLKEYSESGVYPMHMPGHKRNPDFFPSLFPLSFDITEIDGFDNLQNPREILLDEMNNISRIYKSKSSLISVNGSTGAIIACMHAALKKSDEIIMARNCHISVYNAAKLLECKITYVFPTVSKTTGICGSVLPEQIEDAIKSAPDARLIVLTSPTYEGVVSDIKSICEIARSHNIPVLVDEAHGAHFVFSDYFPESAVRCGADMTVQSLHKTLPCFTGSAQIHICGNIINPNDVARSLNVFQTSSPSYLFMAEISRFMFMPENERNKLFSDYVKRLEDFYSFAEKLKTLSVLKKENGGFFEFDMGKIVILTDKANIGGRELYELLLEKYKIQCEAASSRYVICMTSVADTNEGFERLKIALFEIDKNLSPRKKSETFVFPESSKVVFKLSDAESFPREKKKIKECEGCVSGEFIYAYPPDVPLIVPGEIISKETLRLFDEYRSSFVSLYGSEGEIKDEVSVLHIDNGE